MEDKNIYCPVCGSKLEVTHRDHYSDIQDHVSDNNSIPSLKDGYQCLNIDCISNKYSATWIEDGDIYINSDKLPKSIGWSKAHDNIRDASKEHTNFAINSWNYYYDKAKNKVKKRTITLKILKYKINIIPKTYGYNHPIHKQYMPRLIGWNFEFWKKSSEYGHSQMIPITRMISFTLRQFKQHSNAIKSNNNISTYTIKDTIREIYALNVCGKKDDRLYCKIASWIIRHFYKKDVNFILDLDNILKNNK